ncbi:fms-related tyrosine kinase 3 ligand isoform X2 [Ascaphus truei]|uniref:fms-related tyrosine kinase 3 ligand isoform X2 n=1 Tax=Ascaphus truei TaxID=8439 RepID=UPI003F5A9699
MILCYDSQNTLWDTCYMTRRPAPVAVLLLLFLTKTCLTCSFTDSPITSTFEDKIKVLLKHLPLDYPISIISNLKTDSWCSEIWKLHFIRNELKRMKNISGEALSVQINKVQEEVEFLGDCKLNVSSDCLVQEQTNVSIFLNTMSQTMDTLKVKILNDFSNCSRILCEPAPVSDIPRERQNSYYVEMTPIPPTAMVGQTQKYNGDNTHQNNRGPQETVHEPVPAS